MNMKKALSMVLSLVLSLTMFSSSMMIYADENGDATNPVQLESSENISGGGSRI